MDHCGTNGPQALFSLAEEAVEDCQKLSRVEANLASTCCILTRPTLDPSYKECLDDLLSKTDKKHFTSTEQTALNICAEECNFIGNGYTNADPPFALDFDNINDNLDKFAPQPKENSIKFINTAFKSCFEFRKGHANRLDIRFPDVDVVTENCRPFALQITTCVRIYGMQECPEEFFVNIEHYFQRRFIALAMRRSIKKRSSVHSIHSVQSVKSVNRRLNSKCLRFDHNFFCRFRFYVGNEENVFIEKVAESYKLAELH
ncbi:uncharacterized protein LOC119675640 [Teleopsis dalmanni]|uniref:uncharacterized protein LOC119675640 n=1 Tax=Teleopsis dalmanni TaxID=139649 RepID=UPI0018CE41A7|nr:uncharacterized protein LOC119675640 [Teleopsis dalmanni]